jgi:hypothetical protein
VAKSRKSSKSKPSKAKKAPARRPSKKAARPKGRVTPTTAESYIGTGETTIELRPIRLALQNFVGRLGSSISERKESQPDLEEALKRMSRWLDDIQDICGPDMSIPVP